MDEIGRGRTAQVLEWDEGRVLKLFNHGWGEANARDEAEMTDFANLAGAPAPRVYGVTEVEGRWGVVYQRLSGPVMGEEMMASGRIVEIAAELGALLATIHGCDGSGLGTISHQWLRRTQFPDEQELEAEVRSVLDSLPGGTTLLHTDLHPYNVMRADDGEWVAIDWDSAASGDRAADLCRTLYLMVDSDPPDGPSDPALGEIRQAAGEALLIEYRRTHDVSDADIAAWRIPMLAARVGEGIEHERERLLSEIRNS